ncbi:protein FAR1-RELATED SEQUENCE 5-like [Lotus japonicus]|uniref:protein FAR1-RELATED SEQUENCE 5-like n=1 Tax=Lotus japonicus TaxID=34305 RepID=UPI00258BBA99|nr:protein FAR1-RELATED SEQUENCE 5-like [Lotus japonicus]
MFSTHGYWKIIKWKICRTYFVKGHNHELAAPRSRHKFPSQRRVSVSQAAEVEMAARSGICQKLIFEFMSRQAGGRENIGCTTKDISNHLSSKRMKEMEEGEACTLLQYFKSKQTENPSIFYEIQLDFDSQITNIFLADAKIVVDYAYFGDVVCFDTTYRTNKNLRPFSPFIGFNHHHESVLFGVALLYDETAAFGHTLLLNNRLATYSCAIPNSGTHHSSKDPNSLSKLLISEVYRLSRQMIGLDNQ